MTSIPELIAQWRAKEISGSALMRGLIACKEWVVPITEEAAVAALAHNTGPALQISTNKEGERCLMLFSSSDNLHAFRKTNGDKGSQHFLTVEGRWVFQLPMDDVDQLWIDAYSPHDIYYKKEQLSQLRDMMQAILVEEALVGLRKGTAKDDAFRTAREYKNYYLPVMVHDGKPAFMLAPDSKGRSLAAAFTADDTFDAFAPQAQEMANGGELQQMQVDGEALYDTFQRMEIDGFVFNCCGPVPAVAFAQAAAGLILQG